MTVHPRPEWRRALHRFRHLIAAVAALAALLIVVRAFAPGTEVWILAGDTPAGTVLDAGHLTQVRAPRDALPAGAFVQAPLGRTIVVDLPSRTILTGHLAVEGTLADRAPPGTLVFPISLADAGSRALAEPGTLVSLVAEDPLGGGTQVVDGVNVIAVFEPASAGLLGNSPSENAVALVAVPRQHASFVLSASGSFAVRVAVTP